MTDDDSLALDFMEVLCNEYGLDFRDYSQSDQERIKSWTCGAASRLLNEYNEKFSGDDGKTKKERIEDAFRYTVEHTSAGRLATGNTRKDLSMIADHYGWHKQLMQAIEEMAELMQAISKYERKGERKGSEEEYNLLEEVADVQIMMEQIQLLMDNQGRVGHIMKQKIERQLERIGKEDV